MIIQAPINSMCKGMKLGNHFGTFQQLEKGLHRWSKVCMGRNECGDRADARCQGLCMPCPGLWPGHIGGSELLKDAGERQDQVCHVGRSIQKRGMDSNRDRM